MDQHLLDLVKMPHSQDRSALTDDDVAAIVARATVTVDLYAAAVASKNPEAELIKQVLVAQVARGLDLM